MGNRNYSGYTVDDRDAVLAALAAAGIVPRHGRVIAEHVTFLYPSKVAAPKAGSFMIVGHAADDRVDAVVVAVGGTIDGPNGFRFHLTLSVAPGVAPAAAKDLVADDFTAVDPIAFSATAF